MKNLLLTERNALYNKQKNGKKDAKGLGFRSNSEQKRVNNVVRWGIPELAEAMDSGKVTPYAAGQIAKLDKKDQPIALKEKVLGYKKREGEVGKGVREGRLKELKNQDKYGIFVEIKCYTSEPKRTARNIASQYGRSLVEPYRALLVEMTKNLKLLQGGRYIIEPDEYRRYSYGFSKISNGDVHEIFQILDADVLTKKTILEEYEIGREVLDKIVKIHNERKEK